MNSALDLYERAGLAPGPVRLEDLDKFQDVLPDYQIKVVSACYLNTISTVENQTRKIIHLYLDKERDHYYVIVNMKAFVEGVYYCIECEKSFNTNDYELHSCPGKCCGYCKQLNCEDLLSKSLQQHYEMIICQTCERKFFGEQCLRNHLSKSSTGQQVDILSANSVSHLSQVPTVSHQLER